MLTILHRELEISLENSLFLEGAPVVPSETRNMLQAVAASSEPPKTNISIRLANNLASIPHFFHVHSDLARLQL